MSRLSKSIPNSLKLISSEIFNDHPSTDVMLHKVLKIFASFGVTLLKISNVLNVKVPGLFASPATIRTTSRSSWGAATNSLSFPAMPIAPVLLEVLFQEGMAGRAPLSRLSRASDVLQGLKPVVGDCMEDLALGHPKALADDLRPLLLRLAAPIPEHFY